MEIQDYHAIIVWNSNKELIQIILDTFKENIIYTTNINLSAEARKDKIAQLYAPITLLPNDLRLHQKEPITIFILKLNPHQQHFEWRTEGYRLCNSQILQFKKDYRRQFDYTVFHCTDNVLETEIVLKVFELNNINLTCAIVPIDNLYHLIHDGYSLEETYKNKQYKIVQTKHSPVVKYILGDKEEYTNGSPLLIPRENSIEYHLNMNLTQSHPHCTIFVHKYKDKYIVADGMHRSSVLYFNGDRHILVHFGTSTHEMYQFTNYLCDEDFKKSPNNSHLENFHETIFRLNNAQIRYLVIRGFHHMPARPNTDLDIVIHPEDFTKFTNIMNELIYANRIVLYDQKIYKSHNKELWYKSYKTVGILGEHLPNQCYQLDIYSDVFYFGGGNNAVLVDQPFRNHLFSHIQKFKHLNIPGIHSELVLLVCRVCIDKAGVWSEKHKVRAMELISHPQFGHGQFLELLRLAVSSINPKIIEEGKKILSLK